MDYLSHAKLAIQNEIEGIKYVESKLDDNFNKIIDTIHFSSGRVVMCGMGKSGHIAKKFLLRWLVQALQVCLCILLKHIIEI